MSDLIGAKKLNATLIFSSSVSSDKKLNVTLNVSETPKMIGCLASSNIVEGTIGHRVKEPLDYSGAYEVTSMIDIEQTLETAKRYLDQNIKVKAIPYAEVSNLSGGRTVTIGG